MHVLFSSVGLWKGFFGEGSVDVRRRVCAVHGLFFLSEHAGGCTGLLACWSYHGCDKQGCPAAALDTE